MLAEIKAGILVGVKNSGNVTPARSDATGALVVADGHGKYVETVMQGNVYFTSVTSASPTAYVGAAGGTPLIAVHNPTGSNKAIAIIGASGLIRVTATGAGTTDLCLWAGASVTPTGSQTSPKNALTFANGGVGLGFSNAALTASTALNLALVLNHYYWATAAGATAAQGFIDVNGLIVLMPGMQAALGATVVPTSTTRDASLWWEEIQIS
jgi:hypothetical protein